MAGDIVAAEDGNGTLKTILTRSVDRWQIFVAKVLAALTLRVRRAASLFVGVGLVVGGLFWGFDPLVSLSGTHDLGRARAAADSAATTLAYFLPTIAVASIAILLSTLSPATAPRRSSGR